MLGKLALMVIAIIFIGLSHAGVGGEVGQQMEIEEKLRFQLEDQKLLSEEAYFQVVSFAESALLNRDEQLERLLSAHEAWDDFIIKICLAKSIESIGTKADQANNLQCMIDQHREKKLFLNP